MDANGDGWLVFVFVGVPVGLFILHDVYAKRRRQRTVRGLTPAAEPLVDALAGMVGKRVPRPVAGWHRDVAVLAQSESSDPPHLSVRAQAHLGAPKWSATFVPSRAKGPTGSEPWRITSPDNNLAGRLLHETSALDLTQLGWDGTEPGKQNATPTWARIRSITYRPRTGIVLLRLNHGRVPPVAELRPLLDGLVCLVEVTNESRPPAR